jgi:hypothetical protein
MRTNHDGQLSLDGALPAPDLNKCSVQLIELENRFEHAVESAAKYTLEALQVLEEIHRSKRWKTELDYERFGDYYQARWGQSVKGFYQQMAQIKWWKETMLPALTEAGADTSTMVDMPPERPAQQVLPTKKELQSLHYLT